MASSYQRHEAVELFTSTEPHKLDYIGTCTVDIKVLSKMFIIQPDDKDKNTVEISLYAPFFQHKNILCHLSSSECNNVALVFPSIDACKAIYDLITKYQIDVKQEVGDSSTSEQLKDQILIPLLNETNSNSSVSESTKECIINMLQDIATTEAERNIKSEFGEPLHEEFTASSKESSSEPVFVEPADDAATCSSAVNDVRIKTEPIEDLSTASTEFMDAETIDLRVSIIAEALGAVESTQNESRKRRKSPESSTNNVEFKQCKIEVPDEPQYQPPQQPLIDQGALMATKKIIKSTHFLIHRITNYGRRKHELILFITDQKNLCYTYFFERKHTGNRFSCITCHKLKHSAIAHLRCNSDNGEFYVELGLIKHICAPINYDAKQCLYIEPCTLYPSLFFEAATKKKQGAAPKEKSKTFAQMNRSNSWLMGPAIIKEKAKPVPPPKSDADESNNDIVPQKILKQPEFEIQEIRNYYNVKKLQLIVFATPDHKYCYVFSQHIPHMRFSCRKCQRFSPCITAFLRDGDDGEKFVYFNEHPHVCEPELYSAFARKNLDKNEYFLLRDREGNIRPVIYLPNDRNLCYVFSRERYSSYDCEGCGEKNPVATLHLKIAENGECSLTWKTSVHSCQPKAVSAVLAAADRRDKALLPGQYKFFNDNSDSADGLKLLTFPFNEENDKCYIYQYSKALEVFCCIKCLESDHVVIAAVFTNLKKEEYVLENPSKKHICEPYICSSLTFDNILIKSTSGLGAKKYKDKIWDEKNRIQASNFELQRNGRGILNGILCVFTSAARDNCYRYSYDITSLQYTCRQCIATAKLFCDDVNGKYFLSLSSVKHRCQQHIYLPEKTIIRKPDYIITDKPPIARLIIFPWSSREYCYVLSSRNIHFACNRCVSYTTHVHAKIFTDENGDECVMLGRNEHQCEPQLFEKVARKYGIEL